MFLKMNWFRCKLIQIRVRVCVFVVQILEITILSFDQTCVSDNFNFN